MSTKNKAVLALCLIAFAACARQAPEPTYVAPPVQAEPVFTGKYN